MPSTTAELTADSELHVQIERFYARQMHLLDDSRTTEWAASFTEDGVFAANAQPAPVTGRENIAAAAATARAALRDAGLMHRHWLGMIDVDRRDEDSVRVTSYALVIETPRGGSPSLRHSTRCEDLLVRSRGSWLVKHRMITRDDLG